ARADAGLVRDRGGALLARPGRVSRFSAAQSGLVTGWFLRRATARGPAENESARDGADQDCDYAEVENGLAWRRQVILVRHRTMMFQTVRLGIVQTGQAEQQHSGTQ